MISPQRLTDAVSGFRSRLDTHRDGYWRSAVMIIALTSLMILTSCKDDWEWKAHVTQGPDCSETWWVTATVSFGSELGGYDFYDSPKRSPTGTVDHNVCVVTKDPTGEIDRPVIIVDGIDALNQRHWNLSWNRNSTPSEHREQTIYEILNQENLLTDGYDDGLDFVIVDPDGGDFIQNNAFLLVEVINRVNREKSSDQPLVVVGPSMGGIISRYALAYMEQAGQPHDVGLYISWDAPHRGANVAVGNQLWIEFFATHPTDKPIRLTGSRDGAAILDSRAARQLLIHHYRDRSRGWEPRLERRLLVDELERLGYPQKPRTIAISNGSGFGESAPTLDDNGNPLVMPGPGSRLLNWVNGGPLNSFDCQSWAVSELGAKPGNPLLACKAQISNVWKAKRNRRGNRVQIITPDSAALDPLDSVPGSYIDTSGQIGDPKQDLGGGDIRPEVDGETHMPTWSVFDIDPALVGTGGVAGLDDVASATPFDAIYYPAANQRHVAITPENKAWILDEINATFTARPPIGPTAMCAADLSVVLSEAAFNETSRKLLAGGRTERTVELPTDWPVGTYAVRGVAYDGYRGRALDAGQEHEVWVADILSAAGNVLATTAPTLDLADGEEATWEGSLGRVTLSEPATKVRFWHGQPGDRSPNSVHPVCLEVAPIAPGPEPSLIEVLAATGFTDVTETAVQRFGPGTYDVELLAEFSVSHASNSLERYPVGSEAFDELIAGPVGKLGVTTPGPGVVASFASDSSFGLGLRLDDDARHLTEAARNTGGERRARVFRDSRADGVYLIGFEDFGDRDFQDMVVKLVRVPEPRLVGPTATCTTAVPAAGHGDNPEGRPTFVQDLRVVSPWPPYDDLFGNSFGKVALGRERTVHLDQSWGTGAYLLQGGSYDGYLGRSRDPQPRETWEVEFHDAAGRRVSNGLGLSADLPDQVEEASWEGEMGVIQMTAPATTITVRPGRDSAGNPHGSVHPVCISGIRLD